MANIEIGGRLHSTATGNVVTGADEILDDAAGKKQSQVNAETDERMSAVEGDLNDASSGLKDRVHTLEEQVAFDGDFEVANLPSEIVSGSGKIASANAVRGAIDKASEDISNALNAKTGYYGCATAAGAASKVVTATNFVLAEGGSIKIKMTNKNTSNGSVTLNIGGTGAKPLMYDGEAVSATNTWEDGETVEVYYDGTNYYANNVAGGGTFATGEKVKNVGIDDEPTAGSENLVTSGGVAERYGDYTDNPEFIGVVTDSKDRILYGVQANGNFYFGAGCPQQVKDYIQEKIAELSLDEYEDIVTFLDGLEKGDVTLRSMLGGIVDDISIINDTLPSKVDKETGKSLISSDVADNMSYEENPEFADVETDEDGRILGGRKVNGNKVENMPFETKAATLDGEDNAEGNIEVLLDKDEKLISYRKKNGTLVEPKAEIDNLSVKEVYFENGVPEQIKEYVEQYQPEDIEEIPYNDNISIGTKILKIYNPYKDTKAHQYTGQLHCHTWTKFDEYNGKVPYGYTIEQMQAMTDEQKQATLDSVATAFVQRHKDEGYDFMTITDYAHFLDVTHKPAIIPSNFLYLCESYESVTTEPLHIVVHGHGANDPVEQYNSADFNTMMNKVEDYGCVVRLPHPTDTPTYASPTIISGIKKRLRFIEVWDGISMRKYDANGDIISSYQTITKPNIMPDEPFDWLLSQGNFVFGMAISDERPTQGRTGTAMTTPNPSMNIKNGCVKVFADNLTSEDLFNSMMSGNFYASSDSDISINSVSIVNGKYTVDVGIEGVVVEFLKEGGEIISTVTTSSGNTVASCDVTGEEKFIRARLYKLNALPYDSAYWFKNKEWIIWTQPIYISKTIL